MQGLDRVLDKLRIIAPGPLKGAVNKIRARLPGKPAETPTLSHLRSEPPRLSPDHFKLNSEKTAEYQNTRLNPAVVEKYGGEPVPLVGEAEAVVDFSGSGQELLKFVRDGQQKPLRPVDSSAKTLGQGEDKITLKRTGVHLVFKNGKELFGTKQDLPEEFPVRAEIVGVQTNADGGLRLILMHGERTSFKEMWPRDIPKPHNPRDDELYTQLTWQSAHLEITHEDLILQSPFTPVWQRDRLLESLKQGAAVNYHSQERRDAPIGGGSPGTIVQITELVPLDDQRIRPDWLSGNIFPAPSLFTWYPPDEFSQKPLSIVVPKDLVAAV